MIELTGHQKYLGISTVPGRFLPYVICVGGFPVDATITEDELRVKIILLEATLDSFIKSPVFESAASQWAYSQGWRDPDGN